MKLLDLYCGAGLAAIGYQQAGFHVTGVDIEAKSCYAGDVFLLGDALEVLKDLAFCRQFDLIHASPPCQRYSCSTAKFRKGGKVYADLVAETRKGLEAVGVPYIIENVPAAPIRKDIVLRGDMFGLSVWRLRAFELGRWWTMQPGVRERVGSVAAGDMVSVFGKAGYRKNGTFPADWKPKCHRGTIVNTWHYAMGIPEGYKFRDTEISEGIPPAYARYLGECWMQQQDNFHPAQATTIPTT